MPHFSWSDCIYWIIIIIIDLRHFLVQIPHLVDTLPYQNCSRLKAGVTNSSQTLVSTKLHGATSEETVIFFFSSQMVWILAPKHFSRLFRKRLGNNVLIRERHSLTPDWMGFTDGHCNECLNTAEWVAVCSGETWNTQAYVLNHLHCYIMGLVSVPS
jgi:hypothetical protein